MIGQLREAAAAKAVEEEAEERRHATDAGDDADADTVRLSGDGDDEMGCYKRHCLCCIG